MSMCQAYGCSNRVSKCPKIGFFSIPDPKKDPERCRIWLQKIGTDKFDFKTYTYSKNRVVCEEHFEPDCIENALATELGFSSRKQLKPGSVPTIFAFKKKSKERPSSVRRSEEAQRRQIIDNVLCEEGPSTSSTSSLPEPLDFYIDYEDQLLEVAEVVSLATTDASPKVKSPVKRRHRMKTTKHSSKKRLFKSPKKTKLEATVSLSCQTEPLDYSDFQQQFPEPALESRETLQSTDHAYYVPKDHEKLHEQRILAPTDIVTTVEPDTPDTSGSESYDFQSSSSSDQDSSQTYDPGSSSSGNQEEIPATLEQQYLYQSKFLVFIEHLEHLFYLIPCPECGLKTTHVEDHVSGSLLVAKLYCANYHLILDWKSQPVINKVGVGNILVASAILFSGNTFGRVRQFSEFLGLNLISRTTFFNFQRKVLNPVIDREFRIQQDSLISSMPPPPTGVMLSGDGRCDSPGYSAKFCTYSMMNMDTAEIVTSNVVQVTETTSSVAMEKLGFQRCMEELNSMKVKVDVIATDRHTGIRSSMKKDYSHIDHQFDVWHLAKSVKKKIIAKGRSQECADLMPWLQAISNHLWWSAQTCGGDADLLVEKWTSLTYHITNVHEWVVGEHFKRCAHPPLTDEEERTKAWLEIDSPAHTVMNEVLFDKRLLNDIRMLNRSCHTGQLELFHGALLKYCPKRLHFDMPQMWSRTQLAIIDHNANTFRQQAVVKCTTKSSAKKGHNRYKLMFSKATKKWTVKAVYEPKTYGFVFALMENVLSVKMGNLVLDELPARPLPPNIAPVEAPQKADAVSNFRSRFTKDL